MTRDPLPPADSLSWQQDEPGTWVSNEVPCTDFGDAHDPYLSAVVEQDAPDEPSFRWRVDYHPDRVEMPHEGVVKGTAASLAAAQRDAAAALHALPAHPREAGEAG